MAGRLVTLPIEETVQKSSGLLCCNLKLVFGSPYSISSLWISYFLGGSILCIYLLISFFKVDYFFLFLLLLHGVGMFTSFLMFLFCFVSAIASFVFFFISLF
uniref:Uncharacterized protein n=1 Tax=Cacopsylla melanoneura TaxID=428564 RepID=A0A8D9E956_9HEMI